MKPPQIDSRTKEDLIRYMKKYLSSYTPEWRFDEENMDVGTALALIYADMMAGTLERFNQVPEKNKSMFFRMLGADLLPAVPAEGYVTFSLVSPEMEGVALRRGEAVLADTPDGETVTFETQNDVYVTPASPDCIYLCDRASDQISLLFEQQEEETPACTLFDFSAENLQEHVFWFSHPTALQLRSEAWIRCTFYTDTQRAVPAEIPDAFADGENVAFEYFSGQGFVPFEERKPAAGGIDLKKGAKQPEFSMCEHDGVESFWIRCRVKDVKPFKDLRLGRLELRSSVEKVLPDAVNAGGVDQKIREFFPFGERPSLYDEVYFLSNEVLGKKGARVSLEFDLDFAAVPMEIQEAELEINWRAIMRRSEIKADLEYDISVEEVIWEYFNGDGYARLFPDEQYADVFSVEDGTSYRRVRLEFSCPEDMEPAMVNSSQACCIRARVLKMNNLFKTKGKYITPLISSPRLSFHYQGEGCVPEYFSAVNHLETVALPLYAMGAQGTSIAPLTEIKEETESIYLGFRQPPLFGPIKMLFALGENMQARMPGLLFEYSSERDWNTLNIADETDDFRRTGIITMIGNPDFSKKRLFGKERYWIRITDVNREYRGFAKSHPLPELKGLYMNTTQVRAVETMEPEYFTILPNEENKRCRLRYGQISSIHVWVNEYRSSRADGHGSTGEYDKAEYEYTPEGEVKAVWVEWEETKQFDTQQPDKRWYRADHISGEVTFPDGKNGRIPDSGDEPTIRIEYSSGGGAKGNLPRHSILRMNRTVGFVSGVDNHEITTGGCDQEQSGEALERSAAALCHGYRAVTVSDYEALAREASRNILKARCFSNHNAYGQPEYGHVTLIVLTKNYEEGHRYFDTVRNQIKEYMKSRVSPQLIGQGRFHIMEPDFLELSVTVTVDVQDYNHVFDVRRDVQKKIADFLNPATGNYRNKGWEIGSIPNETQILNALKEVKDIYYIEGLRLDAKRRNKGGTVEVDLERAARLPYVLPLNGKHEVIVKVRS